MKKSQISQKWLPLIGSFLLLRGAICFKDTTIVHIETGPVRGHLQDGDLGSKFYAFRGVPYSKQPVGDLRFEPLQPADSWTDVYDAVKEVPICIQLRAVISPVYLQNQVMDEACLGVNIHVPAKRTKGHLLPVLVFLHGASFNYFSSDPDIYGPEFLVAKDVVVVTFNYRLNIFGYLSLNSPDAPGNLGLKDAIFLLNWVQRNIAAFGGNPKEVTLGGFSTGSASVHLIMMSGAADGLFNKVIMQSGTAISSFMSIYPAYQAKILSVLKDTFDITTNNTAEIFNILKKMDIEKLRIGADKILDIFGVLSFLPVVEKDFGNNSPVINDYPYSEMIANNYMDVPMLIGFTSDEAISFEYRIESLNFLTQLKADPTKVIPLDIALTSDTNKIPPLSQEFVSKYFTDATIKDGDIIEFEKVITDSYFKYPTLRYARYSAKNKIEPMYLYEFTYSGKNNLFSRVVVQSKLNGSGHGDDINYIFKPNFYNSSSTLTPNSAEELTKNRMVQMWSNFIKSGNPTPKSSKLINLQWPPISAETLHYLEIDSKLSIKTDPYPELFDFYDQFYPLKVPTE